jgi:hypothetical protein
VEEIHGALGVGGGCEDRPLVSLKDFQPAFDVGCMILTRFQLQPEVGCQERAAQFGDQLFLGVAFIAPALAPEVAVEP